MLTDYQTLHNLDIGRAVFPVCNVFFYLGYVNGFGNFCLLLLAFGETQIPESTSLRLEFR